MIIIENFFKRKEVTTSQRTDTYLSWEYIRNMILLWFQLLKFERWGRNYSNFTGKMALGATKPYRPLNAVEIYHTLLNSTNVYTNFIVGSQLSMDVGANKEKLLASLLELVSKRVMLRLNVTDHKRTLYSKDIKSFDPTTVLEFSEKDYSMDLLNELHTIKFELGGKNLLWKIVATTDNWLLFLADHTFIDGNTASFALEELVSLLNGNEIDEDCDLVETLIDIVKPSTRFTLKTLWDLYVPNSFNDVFNRFKVGQNSKYYHFGNTWCLDCKPSMPNPSFYSYKREVVIPKEQVDRMKVQLKKHEVKFTSYLVYSILQSLSQITNDPVAGSFAIDLRRFLNHTVKSYGLFVSALYMKFPINASREIDWKYVKYINNQLSEPYLRETAQLLGMLNYVNPKKLIESLAAAPRQNAFEISNLGVRKDFKGEDVSVQDFVFSEPSSPIGPYVSHDVISGSSHIKIMVACVPEFKMFFDTYSKAFKRMFTFYE